MFSFEMGISQEQWLLPLILPSGEACIRRTEFEVNLGKSKQDPILTNSIGGSSLYFQLCRRRR
jgi:hypothetical protein